MKKRLILLMMTLVMTLGLTCNVAATEMSGYRNSPKFYWIFPGTLSLDAVGAPSYALKSSSSPAKGSNTAVYFKEFGTLPTNFKKEDGRTACCVLQEIDPVWNDIVKTYTVSFNGRKVKAINLKTTNTSGKIEGNNKVELKLVCSLNVYYGSDKFTSDELAGNTPAIKAGKLFQYNITIK